MIHVSFSVAGLTSLPHHCREMVFASRREFDLSPRRFPAIAAISGAQVAGQRIGWQFDYVEASGLRDAEEAGEKGVLLVGCLRVAHRGLYMPVGGIDANVGAARHGYGLFKLAGDDCSGEAGLGPVEIVLLALGRWVGWAETATADHAIACGDADVHFRGESIGEVSGHGEPAARIQQVRDWIADGGELKAFNRAFFLPGEFPIVLECIGGGLTFRQRSLGADADRRILATLAGHRRAVDVRHLVYLKRIVQLEDDRVQIIERGEVYLRGHGKVVRRGIDIGINDVGVDLKGGFTLRARRQRKRRAAWRQRQQSGGTIRRVWLAFDQRSPCVES